MWTHIVFNCIMCYMCSAIKNNGVSILLCPVRQLEILVWMHNCNLIPNTIRPLQFNYRIANCRTEHKSIETPLFPRLHLTSPLPREEPQANFNLGLALFTRYQKRKYYLTVAAAKTRLLFCYLEVNPHPYIGYARMHTELPRSWYQVHEQSQSYFNLHLSTKE